MEKMNRIIEIDEKNLNVLVSLESLTEAPEELQRHRLFYLLTLQV